MPKPLSIDLRERIVTVLQHAKSEEGTSHTLDEIAARFAVSRSTVARLSRKVKEKQSIEALPHSGGSPTKKMFTEHEQALVNWLNKKPDLLLRELAQLLEETYGFTITESGVHRVLERLGITRKKNPER